MDYPHPNGLPGYDHLSTHCQVFVNPGHVDPDCVNVGTVATAAPRADCTLPVPVPILMA